MTVPQVILSKLFPPNDYNSTDNSSTDAINTNTLINENKASNCFLVTMYRFQ